MARKKPAAKSARDDGRKHVADKRPNIPTRETAAGVNCTGRDGAGEREQPPRPVSDERGGRESARGSCPILLGPQVNPRRRALHELGMCPIAVAEKSISIM